MKKNQEKACFMKGAAGKYCKAQKVIFVLNNYNAHKPGSFYETFSPEEIKQV